MLPLLHALLSLTLLAGGDTPTHEIHELLKAEKWDEAVELLLPFTERNPEEPWGFLVLGLAQRHRGEEEASRVAYLRVLELRPTHLAALAGLAVLAADAGDLDRGFARLEEAVDAGLPAGSLATNPLYEPFRGDPRFRELVKRANDRRD